VAKRPGRSSSLAAGGGVREPTELEFGTGGHLHLDPPEPPGALLGQVPMQRPGTLSERGPGNPRNGLLA
jgi:hypothetical protein